MPYFSHIFQYFWSLFLILLKFWCDQNDHIVRWRGFLYCQTDVTKLSGCLLLLVWENFFLADLAVPWNEKKKNEVNEGTSHWFSFHILYYTVKSPWHKNDQVAFHLSVPSLTWCITHLFLDKIPFVFPIVLYSAMPILA